MKGSSKESYKERLCITLDSGADWEPFLKDVLKHFSCHVIMNIRLKGAGWDEASIARVKDLVFIYDAQGHVYYTKM